MICYIQFFPLIKMCFNYIQFLSAHMVCILHLKVTVLGLRPVILNVHIGCMLLLNVAWMMVLPVWEFYVTKKDMLVMIDFTCNKTF